MHELSLVQELIDRVAERFPEERVLRVVVEVGAGAAVMPDALAFAFEVCRAGTVMDGAVLDVRTAPDGDGLLLRAVEVACV